MQGIPDMFGFSYPKNTSTQKALAVALCLFIVQFFCLVREYGILYGSYKLQNSYFAMLSGNQSFKYLSISMTELSRVKNRTWINKTLDDFTVKAPNFADNASRILFYKSGENIRLLTQQMKYFSEVLYLRNGTFDTDKYCGYAGSDDWIQQAANGRLTNPIRSYIYTNWFPVLVPLRNVDGSTFQHFMDGTLYRIVQILPLLQNRSVKLLMRRPRDAIVYDMLRELRISSDQLVFQLGEFRYGADILVHSCIKEPLHPTLWQEARRLLGVQEHLQVPMNQSNIVIVTRDGCTNCGRRLLNLKEIVSVLKERYGSDVIKVFRGRATLDSIKELFGKTRMIIGAHGGGFYNMNFAPTGTTIIEFMPTKENGETGIPGQAIFWAISNVLNNKYWRMSVPPLRKKNMVVDLDKLSKLLDMVDDKS